MHRLILDINDSVFNKINYLLGIFPEEDLKIISDIKLEKQESQKNKILEILQKGPFFTEIDDPVAWQREQRDEW